MVKISSCVTRTFLIVTTALCLSVILTGCSPVKRKDGPPNFYVDESKVKNAVPKPEPLAKYGNMTSYKVFGKRYYTLRSSKNYVQVGVASWYGTQFHTRNTSSGEPYDMLAMTAAHKSLPLPTYVEVTNLNNQRKVIVKVNDRGPFSSDRIIDLSYVAAKKLGMLGHGTAKVRIKAINPYTFGKEIAHNKPWSKSKNTHGNGPKPIFLQVGAFSHKVNATKMKSNLTQSLSLPVKVIRASTGARLYLVQVGPLKDLSSAEQITNRLKDLGISVNKIHGA